MADEIEVYSMDALAGAVGGRRMTREEAIADIKHAVNWAKENDESWCDSVEIGSLELAIEALKQPEIIRCKDCEFFEVMNNCGWFWCNAIHQSTKEDRFCWRARRREK